MARTARAVVLVIILHRRPRMAPLAGVVKSENCFLGEKWKEQREKLVESEWSRILVQQRA
jgi:hypothetical protein